MGMHEGLVNVRNFQRDAWCSTAQAGMHLRESDAAVLIERCPLGPRDIPDVPFWVTPAEPAFPERLRRLLEQLHTVDVS